MDRSIRRLGVFLMLLFCALFAQLNYIQVFHSQKLNERPGNSRPIDQAFNQPRGTITTADGVIVARSVPVDSKRKYLRTFPEGSAYAQITGYFTYTMGATGLEDAYNTELSGKTPTQQVRSFTDLWGNKNPSGNLKLTIRSDLQKAAIESLGERKGSVVALDPRTGGVLALWSYPSFDPNLISTHDDAAGQAAKKVLDADPAKPLLARSYRETYAPGSTFKVVTLATGLQTGKATPDTSFPVESSWTPPQTTRALRNFGGESCGGTLFAVLAKSCNTSFARLGVDIGGSDMIMGAQAFGFNAKPPFDLPAVSSTFPNQDFSRAQAELAQSAIGQNSVTATPLEMALIAAGIANGGKVPTPHVVDEVTDQDNRTIKTVKPGTWKTAISPEVAASTRDAMRTVVTSGTLAGTLQVPGLDVGGKTGTAQIGSSGRSHAWVIAWAFKEGETEPFLALAVLVENQSGVGEGTGGRAAGPIARAMIDAALEPMPAPPAVETTTTTAASTTTGAN
jgi:peptidoglycan glycosyltransferase